MGLVVILQEEVGFQKIGRDSAVLMSGGSSFYHWGARREKRFDWDERVLTPIWSRTRGVRKECWGVGFEHSLQVGRAKHHCSKS